MPDIRWTDPYGVTTLCCMSVITAEELTRYDDSMTVKKFTVSVPEELYEDLRRKARAERTTVSSWVADAVEHQLGLRAMDEGIAEYEAEHGKISEEGVDRALAEQAAALARSNSRAGGHGKEAA